MSYSLVPWNYPLWRSQPFNGSIVHQFEGRQSERELPRFENSRNVEMKYGFCCLVESESALLAGIMSLAFVALVQTHSLKEFFLNSTTGTAPNLKSQFVISGFPFSSCQLKHETQTAISYDGLV